MKTRLPLHFLAGAMLAGITGAPAQTIFWEAFNDYRPGLTTSPNATGYDMRVTGEGGVLRNIVTGVDLAASLTVEVEGTDPDNFGLNSPVNPGSPADLLFANRCEIGNDGISGLRNSGATILRLRFTGLDPAKRYKFRGTSSRGGNYNDRWAYFKIVEATTFAAAHADGSANLNLFTATTFPASGLAADEVALNSGDNKAGSLVGWDSIDPGADGSFAIEGRQYMGLAPFGNPSAGSNGYGLTAIYLAEVSASGSLNITGNPENKLVRAGTTATFTVAATSPNPITYRWQKTAPGGDVFSDIPDATATAASYTTPTLTVADDNTKFRCRVTAGADTATSGEATLRVDGVLPTIAVTTGSTNLNAIYLTFSEPMTLGSLGNPANYAVNGGLTIASVTAFDPVTVKLSTSAHTSRTTYAVTVNSVADIAGNPIAPNAQGTFVGFDVEPGAVSVEIWSNVTGDLASLLADPRYPSSPDRDFAAPALDSTTVWPDGPNNQYGGRMRAWLTPAATGNYHFFLRSDNVSELRISPDDSFANLGLPIANDTDAASGFQEPGSLATTLTPLTLFANQRYAIEAVWEEDNGTDHCQVAWREENDLTPADQLVPISGNVLSFYAPPVSPPLGTFTSISRAGGQLTLVWTGPGILQTSTAFAGWADVPLATSPHTRPLGLRDFFRLRR